MHMCGILRVADLLYFGSNQYLSPSKGRKEKRVIKVEKTRASLLRLYPHLEYFHVVDLARLFITLLAINLKRTTQK